MNVSPLLLKQLNGAFLVPTYWKILEKMIMKYSLVISKTILLFHYLILIDALKNVHLSVVGSINVI